MQLSCPPLSKEARSLEDYRHQNYQMHEYNPEAGAMCEIKLKINVVRNLTVSETREDNPCTGFAYREHLLLPQEREREREQTFHDLIVLQVRLECADVVRVSRESALQLRSPSVRLALASRLRFILD